MRPVVLDFETYFHRQEYTLSKMTTESYIRDKRFQAHGAAVKWSANTSAVWYDEPELRRFLADEDWSDVFLICHHAQFDGLILSHHYGVVPKMYGCTLSMARQLLGNHVSASLDSVRKHFGMPLKSTPYQWFEGRRWNEITRDVREQIAEGSCDEVESIWRIFNEFAKTFPAEEYDTVDTTIRMFTEPCLKGDQAVFAKVWQEEATKKATVLERLGVTESELQSSDRFADLLREFGVEPAMKDGNPSKVTGEIKQIYAFAKTDPFMEDLLTDEDEDVRALAEARLGVKSTLLQTRAETMGWMASRGPLCCYLSFCGAHTSRWAGGDSSNMQNWTNGSEINAAIEAPDGYLLGEPDASQIECRLLNFCAGQWDKVEEFRSGADPYIGVASAFYGYAINKKDHPDERQLGKIVELQAGYGSGGPKIAATVRVKSKGKILLDEAGGLRARDAYRSTHPAISAKGTGYWVQAENVLRKMLVWDSFDWGPFRIRCDMTTGKRRIVLPNDVQLIYDTLERFTDGDDTYFRIKQRRGWQKTYGAKLVENCLSGNAKVLTRRGWVAIVNVSLSDMLWDGIDWVSHGGLAEKGFQHTNELNGVRMTAEHKVLSTNGWVRAAQAQGLHRAAVQLPDSYKRCGFDWEEAALALPLRLREGNHDTRFGVYGKAASELRVQEERYDRAITHNARPIKASVVRSLGFDDSAMLSTVAPCLRALWRAWNSCLRAVEGRFSKFLGRHVPYLRTGVNVGAQAQQPRLQPDQLHVGFSATTGSEHQKQPDYRNSLGGHGSQRCGEKIRHLGDDTVLSHEQQLASGEVVCETGLYEPVFDILNCGPRHRFVVLGDDGPFIVHNCIQALARVVISQAMSRLKRIGYRIVMTKHDSLWVLIPENDGMLEGHKQIILGEMSRELPWLPGCPLAAEFKTIGKRYA